MRGEDFDAATAIRGRAAVRAKIEALKASGEEPDDTLLITNEMLCRGYSFLPVDLYLSHATKYQLEDGNIRLPFTSLKGLGEAAANSLQIAGKGESYISVDDLAARSGVSKAVIEILEQAGALEGLPKTSQITLFG